MMKPDSFFFLFLCRPEPFIRFVKGFFFNFPTLDAQLSAIRVERQLGFFAFFRTPRGASYESVSDGKARRSHCPHPFLLLLLRRPQTRRQQAWRRQRWGH